MGEKRKSTGTKVAPAEKRKKIIQNSLKDETTTLAKVVKEAEADVKRTTAYTNNVSSITAMLRQALRGNDTALLHKSLDVKDRRLISKSVAELKASEATALLQAIVTQIQDSPLISTQRHNWLHLLLRHHAQVFSSMPQIKSALEALAEHAQQRLVHQNALLRLLGRTEIVLFQAERRLKGIQATEEAVKDANEPLVVFKQDELSEDENEDEFDEADDLPSHGEDDSDLDGSDMDFDDGGDDEDDFEDDE